MEQEKNNLQTRIAELEQQVTDKQAEIDALQSDSGVDPRYG